MLLEWLSVIPASRVPAPAGVARHEKHGTVGCRPVRGDGRRAAATGWPAKLGKLGYKPSGPSVAGRRPPTSLKSPRINRLRNTLRRRRACGPTYGIPPPATGSSASYTLTLGLRGVRRASVTAYGDSIACATCRRDTARARRVQLAPRCHKTSGTVTAVRMVAGVAANAGSTARGGDIGNGLNAHAPFDSGARGSSAG